VPAVTKLELVDPGMLLPCLDQRRTELIDDCTCSPLLNIERYHRAAPLLALYIEQLLVTLVCLRLVYSLGIAIAVLRAQDRPHASHRACITRPYLNLYSFPAPAPWLPLVSRVTFR
jgi:hypothetical protein